MALCYVSSAQTIVSMVMKGTAYVGNEKSRCAIELGRRRRGTTLRAAINELMDRARDAPAVAREAMLADFAEPVHDSIAAALATRLPRLSSALEEF